MDDETEMSMLFSFPDQSNSFALGFGAGMVWQRIECREPVIDLGFEDGLPIHEDNLEVVLRMANCYGYTMEHKRPENGWCGVRLVLSQSPSAKLRLVSQLDEQEERSHEE